MANQALKPLIWVGSSYRDLSALPSDVQDEIGYALYFAQRGDRHPSTKSLKGFGGGAVLEIVEHDAGGTYRAVYTVKFANAVYVLHVFRKKSTSGIKTAKADIDLIRQRLATAESHHREQT